MRWCCVRWSPGVVHSLMSTTCAPDSLGLELSSKGLDSFGCTVQSRPALEAGTVFVADRLHPISLQDLPTLCAIPKTKVHAGLS